LSIKTANMKKITWFTLLIACPLFYMAQGSSDESRFTLGTKGGFGHSWISLRNNTFNGSWFIGLGSMYHFSEHVSLGIDALYSSEGATSKVADATVVTQLDYFRVPVKLAYYFKPLDSDLRPKVGAGLNAGFLMSDPKNTSAGYEDMDIGANIIAGVDYRLLEGFWLSFDADYYHGFTDIRKGNSGGDMNRNIRLDIGLIIGF
jgi:outer membrane protein W